MAAQNSHKIRSPFLPLLCAVAVVSAVVFSTLAGNAEARQVSIGASHNSSSPLFDCNNRSSQVQAAHGIFLEKALGLQLSLDYQASGYHAKLFRQTHPAQSNCLQSLYLLRVSLLV